MSNLIPKPVTLDFNGEKRTLYWTFYEIAELQEEFGCHPITALDEMFWTDRAGVNFFKANSLIAILDILLRGEREMELHKYSKSDLKEYSRKELKLLVDRSNMDAVSAAIVASWVGSSPEADEDEEKNPKSE